jgi:hypothetical protein
MSELRIFYPNVPSGGGDDFSVANVTINCTQRAEISGAIIYEEGDNTSWSTPSVVLDETQTIKVILVKGQGWIYAPENNTVEVISGDATAEGTDILIEGDCVITLTPSL